MPDPNPNNPEFNMDALSNAVSEGLKKAVRDSDFESIIANIIDQASSGQGGKGERRPSYRLQSHADNVAEATRQSRERFGAQDNSSVSGSASHAAKGILAGVRGEKTPADSPYYVVPPGFGDWAGRPTMQNFFEGMAQRGYSKMASHPERSPAFDAAQKSANRASFMANEVMPMMNAAQQGFKRYVQPAYQQMQKSSNLGETQMGGGPVGGEINFGPFGFRNPINRAFTQGLGIQFHQMGEAMGAGINRQQMQQIDNAMFGMGFNFNNRRFITGEKALENIARYNPSIDTQMAGHIAESTMRYGTDEELAKLTNTIKDLTYTSKSANVSVSELGQQLMQYQTLAGKMGGTAPQATMAGKGLADMLPGMDPSLVLQNLRSNPMGMQAAMSRGFMPYQVGGMSAKEQYGAFTGGLAASWKQITGRELGKSGGAYSSSQQFEKDLGTLQGLYGYENIDATQLKSFITNARRRADIGEAEKMLPGIHSTVTDKMVKAGRAGGRRMHFEEVNTGDVNKMLRRAGLGGKAAEHIKDAVFHEQGGGGELRAASSDWRKQLESEMNKRRVQGSDAANPKNIDKLIKGLSDAVAGARELKNTLPKDARKNGG